VAAVAGLATQIVREALSKDTGSRVCYLEHCLKDMSVFHKLPALHLGSSPRRYLFEWTH
jgi:hypothetical protein